MYTIRQRVVLLIAAIATLMTGSVGYAADLTETGGASRLSSMKLGVEISSGDYGSSHSTTVVTVPVQIGLDLSPDWYLRLEAPMVGLYTTTDQSMVVTGGGTAIRRRGTITTTTTTTTTATTRADVSNTGLGDINARLDWTAYEGSGLVRQCLLYGYVKLPTGDDAQGLGTGTVEGGPGMSVSTDLSGVRLFVDAGYYVQNSTATYPGRSYVDYQIGVEQPFGDRFKAQLMVKGASAKADGAEASQEVRLKGLFMQSRRLFWDGYLMTGLTDSTPTIGGGMSIGFYF